jgi:hypothetical protein
MKKALLLTALLTSSLMATLSVSAALNLIQDPGFEDSEFGVLTLTTTPWFNPNRASDVTIGASNPQSGSFNAAMTSTGELADLIQSLTLTADLGYTINFWIADPGQNGGTLLVDFGTASFTVPVSGGSAYIEYNFNATPTITDGALALYWSTTTSSATLDVDNVSVAVPEPTTVVSGTLVSLPFAASMLRQCKKVSA